MKRIILLSLTLSMVGCTESNTSLDINLFNTASEKCRNHLVDSLKSPSSLKISQINITSSIAKASDVYSVFGNYITTNGVIKDKIKEDKRRFRDLTVDIDYEAHNTYGTSLRGLYQCKYIFMLKRDETSPKALNTYLYKIDSDGKYSIFDDHIPIASFSGSNFFLNSDIKKIIGVKDSQFNQIDTDNYNKVEAIYSQKKQEAETMRALKKQYQDDMDAAEKASTKAEAASKAIRKATNYADYDAAVEAADKAIDEADAALAKSKVSLAVYLKASSASPHSEIATQASYPDIDDPRLSDVAITRSGFPRD